MEPMLDNANSRRTPRLVVGGIALAAVSVAAFGLGRTSSPHAVGLAITTTSTAGTTTSTVGTTANTTPTTTPVTSETLPSAAESPPCAVLTDQLRTWARGVALRQESEWFMQYDDVEAAADTIVPTLDGAPAATTKEPTDSQTNVQEVGIDEADLTEHDGRYLFASVNGHLRIVDTTNGSIAADLGPSTGDEQLILHDDRLFVSGGPTATTSDESGSTGMSSARIYDVTDRRRPTLMATYPIDGRPVSMKSVGSVVHLVAASTPQFVLPNFVTPTEDSLLARDRAHQANEATITAMRADHVLPEVASGRLRCDQVVFPESFSGGGATAVYDLNLKDATLSESALVYSRSDTVYESNTHIYTDSAEFDGSTYHSVINVFGIDEGSTKYIGSMPVNGKLLNQFAMSEHDGYLRIATTLRDHGSASMYTYKLTDVLPEKVSELNDLGAPGDAIYAVRFTGTTAYVVTFLNTDPLYVIDLSDPLHPTKQGELKIPGYSNYLQVVSKNRVIGVGQDTDQQTTDSNGHMRGAGQVSLFDVSDPTNPIRLDTLPVGEASAAEGDAHAFLWWAKTQTLVIPYAPASRADDLGNVTGPRNPVMVIAVDGDHLVRRGRVTHQSSPTDASTNDEWQFTIRRSMVINDQLVTVSRHAVKSTDLVSLYPNWYLNE
jgi:Beta propeller domain